MSNQRQTTEDAPRWSPKPLTSCCLCWTLKQGIAILSFFGFLSGFFLIGVASIAMYDKATDPCLKEPSNPGCTSLTPTDGNSELVKDLSIYILLFTGIFQLIRSTVGCRASGKENLASARFYMYSWFVVVVGALYSFVYGLVDPTVEISLFSSLALVESLYYAMVAWSFYQQLERRDQRSVSNEELATGLTHPDIEMA